MEPTGVAVGAVSLVAIFKTCLELYDTIECGRRYGADFEVLTTKVGVERLRLSLWADTVGLANLGTDKSTKSLDAQTPVDVRLKDPRIVRAVADVLTCMCQLFEDTASLTRRYGLRESELDSTSSSSSNVIETSAKGTGNLVGIIREDGEPSNALMSIFRRTYERLQMSSRRLQQQASWTATVRWAVKDNRRFNRFVEDLRGFNDSLSALFPDIDEACRESLAEDIKASTDLDGLAIVEKALEDLDGVGDLAEVASTRITEISQHAVSIFQQLASKNDNDDDDDDDTSYDNSDVRVGDINVDKLVRQIEKLEIYLATRMKGCVEISIYNIMDDEYYGFLTWDGVGEDGFFIEKDREAEYVKKSYSSWLLMYATEKKSGEQGDFSRQDPEASRKFEGKYPGTRTIEGYAANFSAWSRQNRSHFSSEQVVYTTASPPNHDLSWLVDRLHSLQTRKSLPWGWSNQAMMDDFSKLLGPACASVSRALSRDDTSSFVIDLLSMLNRSDMFGDVRGESLGGFAVGKVQAARGQSFNLANFLYQMILSYELKLYHARAGDVGFGNFGPKVVAMVEAADRWVNGVFVKMPNAQASNLEYHSLLHERQVEGLIRFAEVMAWPNLPEMRAFVENAYASIRSGGKVDAALWDWLFATVLPGNSFVFTIMAALVAGTPSLRPLQGPSFYLSGLVLEDRSYWRAASALGRVLGALHGIRNANGWVGPCPKPVGPEVEELKNGWWRVQPRVLEFVKRDRVMLEDADEDDVLFSNLRRVDGDMSRSAWIRSMADSSKWIIPVGPSNSKDVTRFRALRFKSISPEHHGAGFKDSSINHAPDEAGSAADGPSQKSLSAPLVDGPPPADKEPAQRAFVDLIINDKEVTFTVYSSPTFVAAPRCIDGPHPIHERDLHKVSNIIRVSALSGYADIDRRVLIIDATGSGECELAARAWCSEVGRHAIIRRGTGTCFTCAVLAASTQGLGVGCLIWA